jgi:hypothetical protein
MPKDQTNKDEKIVQRPARLPQKLWIALDAEANRCRRSSTKQLEAILLQYYGFEDVELHFPFQMPLKTESTTLHSAESRQKDKKRARSNYKIRSGKEGSKRDRNKR